jgi:hypothetical protein
LRFFNLLISHLSEKKANETPIGNQGNRKK